MHAGRPIATAVRRKLTDALSPFVLVVNDESWMHQGHSGNPAKDDGSAETHFSVEIVSDAFVGMSKVKRQRSVYALLDEELREKGLHALQMKTMTSEEYDKAQQKKQ